jgi:hypothetical protein
LESKAGTATRTVTAPASHRPFPGPYSLFTGMLNSFPQIILARAVLIHRRRVFFSDWQASRFWASVCANRI